MARFLLAWEIGAGLGHAMPLAALAGALLADGHEVHLAWRDLGLAPAALGPLADHPALRPWQAPVWLPTVQGLPPAASYAELLMRDGFLDAPRLAGLLRGWRTLFAAVQPALLVAEHAPTALLAARLPGDGTPRRRALLGNGFFAPPPAQPLPGFRTWQPADPRRLAQGEAQVLQACNEALARVDAAAPPLKALHELLAVDATLLTTWPELDPYAAGDARPGACYVGPPPAPETGVAPHWPAGDGPAVFAYLKASHPEIDTLLQQLAAGPARVLAHVPGLPEGLRARHAGRCLAFSDAPVRVDQALAQARAVVCHGGAGLLGNALAAGVPLLLLPMQAEQMLNALRAQATGAAQLLGPRDPVRTLAARLAALIGQDSAVDAARALAAHHADEPASGCAVRLARRCAALVAG